MQVSHGSHLQTLKNARYSAIIWTDLELLSVKNYILTLADVATRP